MGYIAFEKTWKQANRGAGRCATSAPRFSVYLIIFGGPSRGKPAFVRASTIFSILVTSSSKWMIAMWVNSLTSDFPAFATLVRVQLTLSRVKGHSQFGSMTWMIRSLAIADEAPIRMASITAISTRKCDLDFMEYLLFNFHYFNGSRGQNPHKSVLTLRRQGPQETTGQKP